MSAPRLVLAFSLSLASAEVNSTSNRVYRRGYKRSVTPPGESLVTINITEEQVLRAPAAVDCEQRRVPLHTLSSPLRLPNPFDVCHRVASFRPNSQGRVGAL